MIIRPGVKRYCLFLRTGGFDESLSFGENWDLRLRLKEHGAFLRVAESLSLSHCTRDSLSKQVERMLDNSERLIEKTLLRGMTGGAKRCKEVPGTPSAGYALSFSLNLRSHRTPAAETRAAVAIDSPMPESRVVSLLLQGSVPESAGARGASPALFLLSRGAIRDTTA